MADGPSVKTEQPKPSESMLVRGAEAIAGLLAGLVLGMTGCSKPPSPADRKRELNKAFVTAQIKKNLQPIKKPDGSFEGLVFDNYYVQRNSDGSTGKVRAGLNFVTELRLSENPGAVDFRPAPIAETDKQATAKVEIAMPTILLLGETHNHPKFAYTLSLKANDTRTAWTVERITHENGQVLERMAEKAPVFTIGRPELLLNTVGDDANGLNTVNYLGSQFKISRSATSGDTHVLFQLTPVANTPSEGLGKTVAAGKRVIQIPAKYDDTKSLGMLQIFLAEYLYRKRRIN